MEIRERGSGDVTLIARKITAEHAKLLEAMAWSVYLTSAVREVL